MINIANSWSLRVAFAAFVLGAGPAQSTAAEEPVAAVPAPAVAPLPVFAAPAPVILAPPAPVVAPQPVLVANAASLDPGEFVWRPELASAGPVEVVVSIPQQIAYVYRGGTLIGVSTVSTGRPGHATPTGRFPIMEKHQEHYSSIYNNAPMPYMQRLTAGGIALHAGHIPGRQPASHGCIRLPLAFARNLFGVTQIGGNVHIIAAAPSAQTALMIARRAHPVLEARGIVLAAR